jgi:hypothetical protein
LTVTETALAVFVKPPGKFPTNWKCGVKVDRQAK